VEPLKILWADEEWGDHNILTLSVDIEKDEFNVRIIAPYEKNDV
jgi:hypothetical protein